MRPPGAIDSVFLLFNLAQPRFVFPVEKKNCSSSFCLKLLVFSARLLVWPGRCIFCF